MKLGLVVIVRDAEHTIKPLLDCVLLEPFAFDELVFVDTGSDDKTREIIADALTAALKPESPIYFPPSFDDEKARSCVYDAGERIMVITARFRWIDDFAAARNYAHSLSVADWQLWLDADDTVNCQDVRAAVEEVEREMPNTASIVLPYRYSKERLQHKVRVFRRGVATWKGSIHEQLVFSTDWEGAAYDEPVVLHGATDDDRQKSLLRNIAMCERAYEAASAKNDTLEAGRMAFYIGQYDMAAWTSNGDDIHRVNATTWLTRAIKSLPFSNYAALAAIAKAHIEMARGDLPNAAKSAGTAFANRPDMPEGLAMLVTIYTRMEQWSTACQLWKMLQVRPAGVLTENDEDLVFMRGTVPIEAAKAFFHTGHIGDAKTILSTVPPELRRHPSVGKWYVDALRLLSQRPQ